MDKLNNLIDGQAGQQPPVRPSTPRLQIFGSSGSGQPNDRANSSISSSNSRNSGARIHPLTGGSINSGVPVARSIPPTFQGLPSPRTIPVTQSTVPSFNRQQPYRPHPDDPTTILTPAQARGFNSNFFFAITRHYPDEDSPPVYSPLPHIRTDIGQELSLFIRRQAMTSQTENSFGEPEIEYLTRETNFKVIQYIFHKFRGLINNKGILENIYYIENQLTGVKRTLESKMLADSGPKLRQLEQGYQIALTIHQGSSDTVMKLKRLRFCLMELRESHLAVRRVQVDSKKRAKIAAVAAKLEDYKSRVWPVVLLLREDFSLAVLGRNYEALLSSKLFCERQIGVKGVPKLIIFERISGLIDRKIVLWRSKLIQNLVHQIQLFRTRDAFSPENLEVIVGGMWALESAAKKFEKLGRAEVLPINGYLMEDRNFFDRTLRDLETNSGWIDDKVKQMLQKTYQKVSKK